MQVEKQQSHQVLEQKWQAYEPIDDNVSIFTAFNVEIKNLLKFIIILCGLYLILTLLPPLTIFVISILAGATGKIVKVKLAEIKKKGLANKLSPKLRQILFQKSIFDMYSDILYFPLISKIIGAFVKPLLAKPEPQQLHHTFQNLPDNIQLAIARKGILSLAPQKVQSLVLDLERPEALPRSFGEETWEWKNYNLYQNHHEKVHQETIVKRIVEKVDQKVSWLGFMGMTTIVAIGVYRMNPIRFKKMLVQNGSLVGLVLISLIALAKIKKRVDQAKRKRQERGQIQSIKLTLLDKDD